MEQNAQSQFFFAAFQCHTSLSLEGLYDKFAPFLREWGNGIENGIREWYTASSISVHVYVEASFFFNPYFIFGLLWAWIFLWCHLFCAVLDCVWAHWWCSGHPHYTGPHLPTHPHTQGTLEPIQEVHRDVRHVCNALAHEACDAHVMLSWSLGSKGHTCNIFP